MSGYIYKIFHIPTGLFYCSRKGRFDDQRTNLSIKGNFYEEYKRALKVLKEDCPRSFINKSQKEKFNITNNKCEERDFVIVKYELILTNLLFDGEGKEVN